MVGTIFEPLLDRNKVRGNKIPVKLRDCDGLTQEIKNPYQPVTAPNLVKLFFMLHRRKGMEPRLDFRVYLRPAKKLIDDVGPDKAESVMIEAAKHSKHPWGFAFVRRLLDEPRRSYT